MRDKCKNCYFGDKCHCVDGCDDYAPITAEDDTDWLIERGRQEFMNEWYTYANEYSD